ncbi:UNVERIFIED_CONTAM: Adherens junction-associated protein 1 [Gekko kuhli]
MVCAQSGNTRRNSHQRKINQQEESCQNLTDFTPARVPSNLDIFTAYNETLQCSHECVRTPVPVYTEETILPPGDYKTSFNGNSAVARLKVTTATSGDILSLCRHTDVTVLGMRDHLVVCAFVDYVERVK